MVWAAELHANQVRKGSSIPYVSHVLAVAALVLDDGGSEDEAIAALLHDAIEDCGVSEDEIAARFGPVVASIVAACSDAHTLPKPPWRPRKEAYIAHLHGADRHVLRVSAADKLHNVTTMVEDYRRVGNALWDRFNAGRDDILWYYESVAAIVGDHLSGSQLPRRLRAAVDELRALTTSPA